MKSLIDNNLISLKDLARFEDAQNFEQAYSRIRKRVKRNKYSTYQKIKGEGFINNNDSAIPEILRNKILNVGNGLQPFRQEQSTSEMKEQESISHNELSSTEEKIAKTKSYLLKLYNEYSSGSKPIIKAKHKFLNLYNNNAFPEIFPIVGKVNFKTIERWKKQYKESGNDYRILASQYKTKRGSQVQPEQSEVLIKLILNPNQPLVSEAVRMAIDYFIMKKMEPVLSAHTYRRFIEKWKKEHYADWVFFREGENALDDKVIPYVERDYDRIEVGDIIVADGHVLNFEIINPFTGKPKRMMMVLYFDMKSSMPLGYEIAPTENTFAIAVALRRSILRLGKMPKIVYMDNGRAFNAKYFTDSDFTEVIPLFERLGIKVITAIPYHGQSKTIERFFRTFAELERMIPSYVGTSIELQPPRMNRGEKLHNKLYDKMMFGTSINIFQAHQIVAAWFDKYSSRVQQEGHLKGKTPDEIFSAGKGPGVDKAELTFLMMSHRITTIQRNGIRMFGTSYWNEALFGKQWDEILIRYDIVETGSIYCYDKEGAYICEAFKTDKIHPAAGILGSEEDVKQLHAQLERKQSLKKAIVGEAKQFLQSEIYPAVRKQLDEFNIIPLNPADELQQNEGPGDEQTSGERSRTTKTKKKSLVDRWGKADIEPKNKRAMEA